MIKVYEYLNLVPRAIFDCDDIMGYTYEEVKNLHTKTLISEMSPQRLIDLVEDDIRCADRLSKEATIKRLKQRIANTLIEFEPYGAQMDFSDVEGYKTAYSFMYEMYDSLLEVISKISSLCKDFGIAEVESDIEAFNLTAWESALCWHYENGKFITNKEEIGQAIKQYKDYLAMPDILVKSYGRKCQNLRSKTDITGISSESKDIKSASFHKVIRFLKFRGQPTDEAESDLNQYTENVKANKSKP